MLRYIKTWIDQLRWQRLKPMEKLACMLLDHLEGILNYCRTKVPMGVVEVVNGNIKALLRRGRGYSNLDYLLLKSPTPGSHQDPIHCSPESRLKMQTFSNSCAEPFFPNISATSFPSKLHDRSS
jgi:hypothetical protein